MKNILGIHTGHNATVALLQDGKIISCISEERFNRIKNYAGFPKQAVQFILNEAGLTAADIDHVAISGTLPTFFLLPESPEVNKRLTFFSTVKRWYAHLEKYSSIVRLANEWYVWKIIPPREKRIAQKVDRIIADTIGIPVTKIKRYDHHTCHVATVAYGFCPQDEPVLIFSADGGGDMISSTVNIFENGNIKRIAQTPDSSSIGGVYSAVTEFLGMKPMEHEYKVMGLAPYAKEKYLDECLNIFRNILWCNEDTLIFHSAFRTFLTLGHLKQVLDGKRFDTISGAIQKFTEDLLLQWIRAGIRKTGITSIAVTGGVFMNVKANMLIAGLPEVKKIIICPSCGDESIPVGASFLQYHSARALTPSLPPIQNITDLYLGNEYSEAEIEAFIQNNQLDKRYHVTRHNDIDIEIAKLLADHHVVARFSGRMEWGARALGNRSILANPSNFDNIRIINEQIKSRDFWMPFAGSLLEERVNDYLINPKGLISPYMIVTFQTTPLAQKELRAAMHPYDFTIRPQIVTKDWNPSYHALISAFEKLTGIGGILNTSLNLHGEPLVCSLEDALHTFEDSGLQNLSLGHYLIQKTG